MQTLNLNSRNFERDRISYIVMAIFQCEVAKNPDIVVLDGAEFSKSFITSVRKFTVNIKHPGFFFLSFL